MSTHDDEPIEFDFFDEPETVEATQRRRLPRLERPGGRGGGERPPRPPLQTPTGLIPLARLVGLIAIAIVIVVGLVFWVGACQGKSKQGEYTGYADKVRSLATADTKLGKEFANEFLASGLKQSEQAAAGRVAGAARAQSGSAGPAAGAAAGDPPEPDRCDRVARERPQRAR
jgi:hypothetical protein